MQKNYVLLAFGALSITIVLTIVLVSAASSPDVPFDYIEGDDDEGDFTSSVQVNSNYNGDLSEFDLITQEEAERIALTYTTGGNIEESELETEDGNVVWEVEVNYEGDMFDIVIDAGSGEVLGAFYDHESWDLELFENN